MKDIIITKEYKECLKSIDEKEPFIFVSGKAGVGKSVLIKFLKERLKFKNMAVVAPTGIAAINVDGQTIHSFFGFNIGIIEKDSIKIKKGKAANVLKKLDILIIDEISMVRSDVMDAIDISLRLHKGKKEPFGGVQILSVGDLFQLSPVVTNDEMPYFSMNYESEYFFDSNVVKNIKMKPIILDNVFRQKDQEFIEILNRIRENNNARKFVAKINRSCYGINSEFKDVPRDIILTTVNKKANYINKIKLDEINKPLKTFNAKITGNFKVKMITPEVLDLKIGAQVMFTKNGKNWVNGNLGEVLEIGPSNIKIKMKNKNQVVDVKRETWEIKKYDYDPIVNSLKTNVAGEFEQFPLTLAWAITIHKSQGLTLDSVKIDFENGTFATGQAYVALSRCTSLEGISLEKPISMNYIDVDERVVNFYKKIHYAMESGMKNDEEIINKSKNNKIKKMTF